MDENEMQTDVSSPVSLAGPHSTHRGVVGDVLHSVMSNFYFWNSASQSKATRQLQQSKPTEGTSIVVTTGSRPCTPADYTALLPVAVSALYLLVPVPRLSLGLRLEHNGRWNCDKFLLSCVFVRLSRRALSLFPKTNSSTATR